MMLPSCAQIITHFTLKGRRGAINFFEAGAAEAFGIFLADIHERSDRIGNWRSITMGFDAYADAAAGVLGLKIEMEWRRAVSTNLAAVFSHAQKVDDFLLSDEIELAPVFDAFARPEVS